MRAVCRDTHKRDRSVLWSSKREDTVLSRSEARTHEIPITDPEGEAEWFQYARHEAVSQLAELSEQLRAEGEYGAAGIFAAQAMDYILKPMSYPAFETRMERILSRLRKREKKFILISFSDSFRKEPADNIYYIEVTKHKLHYHTKDGVFETKDSLKRVEAELDGCGFARCDNSFLVNLKYVTEVGQKELVAAGETLKISRPRRKDFIDALARFVGGTS